VIPIPPTLSLRGYIFTSTAKISGLTEPLDLSFNPLDVSTYYKGEKMFKITVEATTKKDQKYMDELLMHLCYGLTDESGIKLRTKNFKWNGHSGGDDAYFGLMDKTVKVEKVVEKHV